MSVKTESYRTQEKHESSKGESVLLTKSPQSKAMTLNALLITQPQVWTHYHLTLLLAMFFLKATHGGHLILLLLH